MAELPTIMIAHADGYAVINAADFDPAVHRRYVAPAPPAPPVAPPDVPPPVPAAPTPAPAPDVVPDPAPPVVAVPVGLAPAPKAAGKRRPADE